MESGLKKGAATGDGSRGLVLQKAAPADPQLTLLPPRLPMEVFPSSRPAGASSSMPLAASPFPANSHVGERPFSFSSLLAGVVNSSSASVLQLKEGKLPEADSMKGVKEGMPLRESPGERVRRLPEIASKVAGVGDGATSRTSTARFKAMHPSRLPIPSTSSVTIPPGLSPTTLLDSPVLFATHQCEPSPTTGTYPLSPLNDDTKPWASKSFGTSKNSSSFGFKPFAKLSSRVTLPALTSLVSMGISHQQALEQIQTQAHACPRPSTVSSSATMPPTPRAMAVPLVSEDKNAAKHQVSEVRALHEDDKMQEPRNTESTAPEKQTDYLQVSSLIQAERPSNDGYNWRKYGQKQVKGRENPRSYYKCSYPNCLVKKKVEQNLDGQITEIIYKGEHNHLRPLALYRASQRVAASNTLAIAKDDGTWVQKADNMDHLKAADADLSSRLQCHTNHHSNSNLESSSPSISENEEGTKLSGGDCNEDEHDGKRRKIEKDIKGTVLVPKTICEPRVVVQPISEYEGLDDGYRWRKYGQKMVKGNPHPRSYYKCSNIGCPVRKHVERSPNDRNAVITTYEGRHNHDVPAAKISTQNTVPTAGASPSAAQAGIAKLGSVMRNGGSSQGDGSEFANVASIVARHLEKAQAERDAVALQFQSGVQSSSSRALKKDNKEDSLLSFVKSEPSDSQAAPRDDNYADGNARSRHEAVSQFSETAAEKVVAAIEPKDKRWDNFINVNALPCQSSSTSTVEELRGLSGVLGL